MTPSLRPLRSSTSEKPPGSRGLSESSGGADDAMETT